MITTVATVFFHSDLWGCGVSFSLFHGRAPKYTYYYYFSFDVIAVLYQYLVYSWTRLSSLLLYYTE